MSASQADRARRCWHRPTVFARCCADGFGVYEEREERFFLRQCGVGALDAMFWRVAESCCLAVFSRLSSQRVEGVCILG